MTPPSSPKRASVVSVMTGRGRRRPEPFASVMAQSSSSTGNCSRLSSLVVRASSVYGGTDKRPIAMGGTAVERSMLSIGSIAIYNVKPVHARTRTERKRYTIYAVHVQNAITGRSWVVHRRYSEFLRLRELIVEHFDNFQAVFPRLVGLVEDLYFPRKHRLRSHTGRVIAHRCTAFLEYLVTLHRLLICQNYLEQRHISDIGISILRGFLGSAIVQDPAHRDAYARPDPIPQCKLTPCDRALLNQCGTLRTVVEEDLEDVGEGDDQWVDDDDGENSSIVSDTDSRSTVTDHEEREGDALTGKPQKVSTKRRLFGRGGSTRTKQ